MKLKDINPWTPEEIDKWIKAYCSLTDRKYKDIAQLFRVCLTGRLEGSNITTIMYAFGKEDTIRFIRDQLDKANKEIPKD